MAQDITYRPVPYIFKSRGLIARDIVDQCPEYTYLQLLNCLEREENSMSSRYGTTIINRDPVGTGTSNYYFANPVTSLSRLTYQGNAYRYAGLSDGTLWRHTGNAQGAYTKLTLPNNVQGIPVVLSGQAFTSLVDSCFETSQPFNFIYDAAASIKDQGTGNPQLTGIDPSPYTLNVTPYAPLLTLIDNFAQTNSYATTGTSSWGWGSIETLVAGSGQLITDFSQFYNIGPSGGGTVNYTPSSLTVAVTATQGYPAGTSDQYSTAINGLASVVPAVGVAVSITVNVGGSISGLGHFQGIIFFQYSPDGGSTWTTFYSLNGGYDQNVSWSAVSVCVPITTANLNLVQLRVWSRATTINPAPISVTVFGQINSWYATLTSVGAFGPVSNGMLAILNTNTTTTTPITSVVSSNLTGGIYTQLTVTTQVAHGLVAGNTMAIYASSNDSVDGFYQVIAAPTTTSLTVAFSSATQIGATGGYVTNAAVGGTPAPQPAVCVLTDQYTNPYPSQMTTWGFSEWVPPTAAANITAFSITANVVTFTASNTLVAGEIVLIAGLSTGTYLNGQLLTVSATGLSGSQFQAAFTHANVTLTSDTGTASYNGIFPISAWSGTIAAANSTATISKTIALDFSQNNQVTDDDLIVLTLLTSNPNNIAQIQLQFFTGAGTNNYYTKFISPAYYQSAVGQTQLAYSATQQQILADTMGLITGQPPNTTSAQLQPSNISTGSGSWQACYLRRGDFLPVGQAGQAGVDWANISGWQISVTTNANVGGASFSFNGLYLQWGYGPSSFGGVGYDYRQTYYNANTGTESNGSPIQAFNHDYGYLASTAAPIFLRQAAQVVGQYSNDSQVTHARIYRRGGTLASNWVQVGQLPNVVGAGQFIFKDVVADSFVQQAQILVLDNDPPVTSSLVSPIQTTLSAATTQGGLSSIYSNFSPQLVSVALGSAVFVPNQLVIIGNPSNEELVSVVVGGTGTFTAILRLQHNLGEPVSVYAVPRQPCNLCAYAYNQVWLAGDPNNPHYLYYSKKGLPENFGPQNYIPVTTPDDPINAVINWRGTLIVGTLKSWFIIVGGAQPYAQPTGSQHGIVAQQGWTEVEGAIWYSAADGLREFTGADGVYMTLPIEWIYRGNPLCLPPQADPTQRSQDVMAYYNNVVYTSYISTTSSGERFRMNWDTQYRRFRYDDVPATAMLWERDINTLLVGKQIGVGQYAVVQDQTNDYDDGGWAAGALVQTQINLEIQTPYFDVGKPHNPKQWNEFELDVNTQGQNLNPTLLFDNGATSIALSPVNTTVRQKVELFVNQGEGQQAYRCSVLASIGVTTAPILYQMDMYAAPLAEYSASIDSYWLKFGTEESKIVKQGYFDYTSSLPITCSLYADNSATPYFTFMLPAQTVRSVVRVRFGNVNSGTTAFTLRTWRIVMTAMNDSDTNQFQMWESPRIEWKMVGSHSYQQKEIEV